MVAPHSAPLDAKRDRAVQAGIIGIADRRDGGKPVQRAAQDDDDQARIAAARRAREFRQVGPGRKRRAAEQQRAPRRADDQAFAAILGAIHGVYLLWNSGDISSSAIACWRDSARSIVRRVSCDAALAATASIRSRGSNASPTRAPICAADIEPQLHAFGRRPRRHWCRRNRSGRPATTAAGRAH